MTARRCAFTDGRRCLQTSLIVAVGLVPSVTTAADLEIPRACAAAIDARIPGWRLASPPAGLAEEAKRRKLTTNVVQADFNSDRTRDTAVLLVAPDHDQEAHYIAICLSDQRRISLQVITAPYCRDGIALVPKGTKAHDYETDKIVTYSTNGIHAYCFEVAGGTYLWEKNRFRLVVDSD